jgi:riboflavin kinase/FMN adenylyltransferase
VSLITYHSKQIKGKGIGNIHTVPTINLSVSEQFDLPFGVYAARPTLQYPYGKKTFRGALHYGPRPTTQDSSPSLEVYVLDAQDFQTDYNAEDIEVEIVEYIRDVMKFNDFSQLREQIEKDIVEIREILS